MVNVYYGKMWDIKRWLFNRQYLRSEDVVLYSCTYERETLDIRDINSKVGVYQSPIPRYVLKDIKPIKSLSFIKLEEEIDALLSQEYMDAAEKAFMSFSKSLPICFSFRDKGLDSQFEIEMNLLFDRVGYCSTSLF